MDFPQCSRAGVQPRENAGMAISLICECGKKLAVKEELAGKKVRCPACESLLTVPAVSDEMPARQAPAAVYEAEDVEDQDPDEVRPRQKKKLRTAQSNKLAWIGAGLGVLLLGFCCVGVAAGGGWWFFLRGGPEKTIIGRWGVDVELTKRNSPIMWDNTFKSLSPQELANFAIEIKADGNMSVTGKGTQTAKWKDATSKGEVVTIDSKFDGFNEPWEKIQLRVIDSNHVQFTPMKSFGGSMWLKRL
jgi:hypothetical protein